MYLSKLLIKAERNYHSKYFTDNRKNPKQVLKKINSIIYGQQCNTISNTIDNNIHCEKCNDFFCNIGEKLASKLGDDIDKNKVTNYITNINRNSLFITPTSPDEIINIVFNSKPKNSTDYHNLSYLVWMHFLAPHFTSVYTLGESIFPKILNLMNPHSES